MTFFKLLYYFKLWWDSWEATYTGQGRRFPGNMLGD